MSLASHCRVEYYNGEYFGWKKNQSWKNANENLQLFEWNSYRLQSLIIKSEVLSGHENEVFTLIH